MSRNPIWVQKIRFDRLHGNETRLIVTFFDLLLVEISDLPMIAGLCTEDGSEYFRERFDRSDGALTLKTNSARHHTPDFTQVWKNTFSCFENRKADA